MHVAVCVDCSSVVASIRVLYVARWGYFQQLGVVGAERCSSNHRPCEKQQRFPYQHAAYAPTGSVGRLVHALRLLACAAAIPNNPTLSPALYRTSPLTRAYKHTSSTQLAFNLIDAPLAQWLL